MDNGLSKEAQLQRSPGGNTKCPHTKTPKRSCKCRSCVNRRNRRKGQRKQRDARKSLEKAFGSAGRFVGALGNEETWRMNVRSEVKSGRKAQPVYTFYKNTKEQSDASTAIGDTRPFVAVAMPDGLSYGLVVLRTDQLVAVLDAYAAGLREEQ